MPEKTDIFTAELGFTPDILKEHSSRTKRFGIFFIILGVAAMILPWVFTIGVEILLGCLLLIGGIFQTINARGFSNNRGATMPLAVGIISTIVGVLFLANPFQGAAALTVLLAAMFLFNGILRIFQGIQLKTLPGTGWGIINGVLGIMIAFIVWSAWPSAARWFIGILLGVDFLILGIFLLTFSESIVRESEISDA